VVSRFPHPELLKWTALCASSSNSSGIPTYSTFRLFSALCCDDATEPIESGGRKFETAHRQVRSEIVVIHGSRYDLRHPDITRFVVQHYYDADAKGVLRRTSELGDDLYRILCAILRVRLHENYERFRRGVPDTYIYDIPRSWLLSPFAPDHEVGRYLYENIYERLGYFKTDQRIAANLVRAWLREEVIIAENSSASTEVLDRWLPELVRCQTELLRLVDGSGTREERDIFRSVNQAYSWWLKFASKRGRVGSIVDPEPGTVRYILRSMWDSPSERFRNTQALAKWLKMESTAEAWGSVESPQPYTLRWLCRDLWRDEKRRTPTLVRLWAEMEAEDGNFGDAAAPIEFTSRWICREAWRPENRDRLVSARVIIGWTRIESERGNLGNFDDPHAFSARWLMREAWKPEHRKKLVTFALIREWAKLETEIGELGEFRDPQLYSARWLLREAWKPEHQEYSQEDDEGEFDDESEPSEPMSTDTQPLDHRQWLSLYRSWIQIEAERGELGSFVVPEAYSARWLLRDAWSSGKWSDQRRKVLVRQWVEIEIARGELGNFSDPEIYSARWLLREAWRHRRPRYEEDDDATNIVHAGDPLKLADHQEIDQTQSQGLLRLWVQTESKRGELGEFENPAPYSARWLLNEAWKQEGGDGLVSSELISDWARIESDICRISPDQGKLGDFENPERFTARWLFRHAWESHSRNRRITPNTLIRWAQFEAGLGKLGNIDDPESNSARWILRQTLEPQNRASLLNPRLVSRWASIEAIAGNIGASLSAPEPYSARWLFQTFFNDKPPGDGVMLGNWSFIERSFGTLGDWPNPKFGTARWAFVQMTALPTISETYFAYWAKCETQQPDHAPAGDRCSPEWIFQEAKRRQATKAISLDEFINTDTQSIETYFPIYVERPTPILTATDSRS
jgi:hypothetical protein